MYIQFKLLGDNLLKNVANNFSLKDLSEKLVILLCLLSSQRDQTIKELNIKHMIIEKVNCTFFIKTPMNITNPGFHRSPITYIEFSPNKKPYLEKKGLILKSICYT